MAMRRILYGFALLLTFFVVPLAGSLPASAHQTTPPVQSTPAPGDGAMTPITDPRVDPEGTLLDAFFVSMASEPVVPAKGGTTELQPGEYQFLPADVALTEFYAEFYYQLPAIPEGGAFDVGFCFWFDADGNCYDIVLQIDQAGNVSVGAGYSSQEQGYTSLMTTGTLAEGAIDRTPGAENSIDIAVYDGYVILEGDSLEPLAVLALPDDATPSKVKVEIGFADFGVAPGTAPLAVTISDFAVWDLSSGLTPSLEDLPVATSSPVVGAAEPPISAPTATGTAQTGASVPSAAGGAMVAAIFARERAAAQTQPPLVAGASGELTQVDGAFVWTSAGANVADFYTTVTVSNPLDLSVSNDIGIGFRVANQTQSGVRFIITSTGAWYLQSPADETIASGIATGYDPAPGASNLLEVVVHGTAGFIAVNGALLQQVDLSAFGGTGDVYVGSGFFQGDTVAGRVIAYHDWWVYPI